MIARGVSVVLAGLFLFGIAGPASASTGEGAGGAQIVAEKPLDGGGIELTIETPAFTAPALVEVFLPAGYDADPERRWPVTYYLHGAQGDQARFHDWFGDLIADHPSIVISPDGGGFGFYSDWYNGGAGGAPMYETYFVDQLIPLIDQRFRTTADRAGRALIGESMGGYGVTSYAARHPDLFAAAASMSGAVNTANPFAIALVSGTPPAEGGLPNAIYGDRATQEVRWRGHNPVDLAGNLAAVDLQVRTAQGTPNPAIEGNDPASSFSCGVESQIFQMNIEFHQRLLDLGVPHQWQDLGTGCHSLPIFRQEFTDSLPRLEQVIADRAPEPRRFSYRSIEPTFDIFGWQVDADPARALEFMQMGDAGSSGLTLVGSGTTRVATPPFFPGLKQVDVVTPEATEELSPDRDGRLRFDVDLGAPNSQQQYTPGATTTETSRAVSFEPHARVKVSRVRASARRLRVCAYAVGGAVTARMHVVDAEDRVATRPTESTVRSKPSCRALRWDGRPRGAKGALLITGEDQLGHAVSSRRNVRLKARP